MVPLQTPQFEAAAVGAIGRPPQQRLTRRQNGPGTCAGKYSCTLTFGWERLEWEYINSVSQGGETGSTEVEKLRLHAEVLAARKTVRDKTQTQTITRTQQPLKRLPSL